MLRGHPAALDFAERAQQIYVVFGTAEHRDIRFPSVADQSNRDHLIPHSGKINCPEGIAAIPGALLVDEIPLKNKRQIRMRDETAGRFLIKYKS